MKHIIAILVATACFSWQLNAEKKPSNKEILELIKISNEALVQLNFEKSLTIAKSALKQSVLIKDNVCISNCYCTIACNLEELAELDKALEYYQYAFIYAEKAKDLKLQNHIYNNRANIYFFEKKQYKLGIENYNKSIACSKKSNDLLQILYTRFNLSWAYFTIKDYKNAFVNLEYINKNKNLYTQPWAQAYFKMLNGMGFAAKNDKKNANANFLNAIAIAKSNNLEIDLFSIYEEYATFLLSIKEYKNAYYYQEKFHEIKEKSDKDRFSASAKNFVNNIDADVYKNEFFRSEAENKNQKEIIKKTSIINWLFGVTMIFLILILLLLFKNFRIKNKNSKLLVSQNQKLALANFKAIESSNLKSQFVSTISHELRTPLYGVIGITNMLLDEKSTPFERKHLKSLEFSANYLLSLVNDILHLNKIEEQEFELAKQDFDISDEVNLIINALSFSLENNNNTVSVNIDSNIPKILVGDKTRLNQILINLLGNALKFTKNGTIKITVSLVKMIENNCEVKFIISDNGVGIAKEDQEKIFDKFVQVGKANADYQGTGLGLSIVKKLIQLFDSTIKLESEIGKGTTFSFAIQFDTKKQSNIDNTVIDYNPKNLPIKVLIVEDNKINQLVTKKIIEKFKASCVLADNGFQAIELLKTEVFDIILMDINMPEIDGFETSKLIRKNGITIPIIALTAYSKNEIMEKALQSGINDVLIKPFEESKLYEIAYKQLCKQNAD